MCDCMTLLTAQHSTAQHSTAQHGLVAAFFLIKLYTMMDNRRIDETDMSC